MANASAPNSIRSGIKPIAESQYRQRPRREIQLRIGTKSNAGNVCWQASHSERPQIHDRCCGRRVTTTPRKLPTNGAAAISMNGNIMQKFSETQSTSRGEDGRSISHLRTRATEISL